MRQSLFLHILFVDTEARREHAFGRTNEERVKEELNPTGVTPKPNSPTSPWSSLSSCRLCTPDVVREPTSEGHWLGGLR